MILTLAGYCVESCRAGPRYVIPDNLAVAAKKAAGLKPGANPIGDILLDPYQAQHIAALMRIALDHRRFDFVLEPDADAPKP